MLVPAERIPKGCLSSTVGDELVAIALGESVQAPPSWSEMLWLVACVVLPGLVAGFFYGMIPLNPPQSGPDGSFLALSSVNAFVCGVGLNVFFAPVLFSTPTLTSGLKSGILFAMALSTGYVTLGKLWRFPVPMGHIYASSLALPTLLLLAVHDAFGLRTAFSAKMRRVLLPPLLLALLPVVFLLVFATYRAIFSQLPPSHQTYVAPLWPLIKVIFKLGAVKIVERANNPDIAPFILFTFDAFAGMSANFLFLSAAEADSVLAMISIDLLENMSMAIKVILLVNGHQKTVEEQERAKMLAMIVHQGLTIKQHEKTLARQSVMMMRQIARQEIHAHENRKHEGADGSVAVEEEAVGEAVPLMDEVDATPEYDAAIGAVLLHKAVRMILSFAASECAEVAASAWSMIMLWFLYYGFNKQYFYVIQDMDDEAFGKAFRFCMLDAGMQLLGFAALGVYLRINTGLRVLEVALAYVRNQQLHRSILFLSMTISITAFGFFVVHAGIDPTLQFQYDASFDASHNRTGIP
jgi:hypothetical protein